MVVCYEEDGGANPLYSSSVSQNVLYPFAAVPVDVFLGGLSYNPFSIIPL